MSWGSRPALSGAETPCENINSRGKNVRWVKFFPRCLLLERGLKLSHQAQVIYRYCFALGVRVGHFVQKTGFYLVGAVPNGSLKAVVVNGPKVGGWVCRARERALFCSDLFLRTK